MSRYKPLLMKILPWMFPLFASFLVTYKVIEYVYEKYQIPPDNAIEEAVEELYHKHTGKDIDFTPSSHE